jgi:hypothetical protein
MLSSCCLKVCWLCLALWLCPMRRRCPGSRECGTVRGGRAGLGTAGGMLFGPDNLGIGATPRGELAT